MRKCILILCLAAVTVFLTCCQKNDVPIFGALISENAEAMRQKGELESVEELK